MSHVDNPFQSPAIISFCTGLRGIEQGLDRVIGPVRPVVYVENEAFLCQNLVAAMETGVLAPAAIWTDLKTFDALPFRSRVHGIIAGYPCTPFSVAGNRKGHTDPRHLWPFILRHIVAAEPIWAFFENVDDHLTLGYDQVYRDLSALGYRVEAGIYSAEEAGAPQERKRVFILAILANAHLFSSGRGAEYFLRPQGESAVIEDQRQRYRDEPGARGEAVADAGSKRVRQGRSGQQPEQLEPHGLPGGNELGDAESDHEWDAGKSGQGREQAGKPGAEELGNPTGVGCEGQPDVIGCAGQTSDRAEPWSWAAGTDTAFKGWPAPQGPFQYGWEPPRTVKSRLVYSTHGYGFMGDLHRAIGNSVVPQCAAIGFVDLLKKHLKR